MYDQESEDGLQFSQAAENNKDVILEQLQRVLPKDARVLEVASGTGQHATHFASAMTNLLWQPSDRDLGVMDLSQRLESEAPKNVLPPIVLDIAHWPNLGPKFDAVYSANCIHIAPAELLPAYVEGVARSLKLNGTMLLYGPFRYDGAFTTKSNSDFNDFLESTYPSGGIRDFKTVDALASENGLTFVSDTPMPANNQFLVWRKGE